MNWPINWMRDLMQRRGGQISTILLMLVACGLLAALSVRFDYSADWTANNRNSLTDASRSQLRGMQAQLKFTAFVSQNDNVRREVKAFIDRYLRYKDNAGLEFIDPVASPQLARELGISADGEVVIEYEGRRENLLLYQLNEQALTAALQRLSFGGDTVVRFLDGHGERKLDDQELSGYSGISKELRDKGLRIEVLNLGQTPAVPAETSVLVVAGPQVQLLPGEVQLIRDYVARGGNLLLLPDPDHQSGLRPVAEDIGVELLRGTVVYPDYEVIGTGHPAMALVSDYPPGGVTQGLLTYTLFPFAGALLTSDAPGQVNEAGWRYQPFLTTVERSWLDTGSIADEIEFRSEDGDLRGPLMIGVALQRDLAAAEQPAETVADALNVEDSGQRIVVLADSDFMANGYLYNIGNLQLAVNIIQWLAHRDSQLAIVIPAAPDTHIYLPLWASVLIGAGFVIVLPLGLITFGLGRWWRRQRR